MQHFSIPACGGSIITRSFVLTSAHCVTDGDKPISHLLVNVVVGNLKVNDTSNRLAVTDIIVHENYNSSLFTADIALLKVGL